MDNKAIDYIRKTYQIPSHISAYEFLEGFSIYETIQLMEDYHKEKTNNDDKKVIHEFLTYADDIYWGENEYNDYKKILEKYFEKDD